MFQGTCVARNGTDDAGLPLHPALREGARDWEEAEEAGRSWKQPQKDAK